MLLRRLRSSATQGLRRLHVSINSNAGGDNPAKRKMLQLESKRQLSLDQKIHTAGGVYLVLPSIGTIEESQDEERDEQELLDDDLGQPQREPPVVLVASVDNSKLSRASGSGDHDDDSKDDEDSDKDNCLDGDGAISEACHPPKKILRNYAAMPSSKTSIVFDTSACQPKRAENDGKSRNDEDTAVTSAPSLNSSSSSLFSSYTQTKSQRNIFASDLTTSTTMQHSRRNLWKSSGENDHHYGAPLVGTRSRRQEELIDPNRPELILGEEEVLSKILVKSRHLPKHTGSYASLHVMINNERVKRQIAPLHRMAELDTMAREHAKVMAQQGTPEHPCQRYLERVVIATLQEDHNYQVHRIGCNVWSCGMADLKDTQRQLMDQSPSDRNNILDRRYTHMGVGTHQILDGKLHVCQLFID